MAIDGSSSTTTRLLTLLNVSATKTGKRKRAFYEESKPTEKLNKKRAVQFSSDQEGGGPGSEKEAVVDAEVASESAEGANEDAAEDDELGERIYIVNPVPASLKL